MAKLIVVVVIVLIAVAAFLGGMWWQKEHIGGLRKWQLSKPMELQESPGRRGALPAGTVLYEYRMLPEAGTYIVFITTQQKDALESYEAEDGRTNVIDPLTGYVPENGDRTE